jgi:capsular polysaccharide transport system permease protein
MKNLTSKTVDQSMTQLRHVKRRQQQHGLHFATNQTAMLRHGAKPALHVQLHVIMALMLRELHTINGESKMGYIWTVVQTAFGLAVFWGIRTFMHARAPHGMTVLSFLVLGFLIWNIFSKTLTVNMHAVEGNRSLLTYPHVYPLDIMAARCVVLTATQMVSMIIILMLGALFGYPVTLMNLGLLLAALGMAMSVGLGAGMILSALAVWFPFLNHVVPMLLRIMFFASGVFFSVSLFSHRVGSWLMLNPIMQIIEMARTAMSRGYKSPYFDIHYLLMVNLCVLTTGLLLERFVRRRLQA